MNKLLIPIVIFSFFSISAQSETPTAPVLTAEEQEALNEQMHRAIDEGDTDAVRQLIEKGADVNAESEYGNTALMYASRRGRTEIAKLLLDAGADVNAESESGNTALMSASINGQKEIVELLLEEGADVSAEGIYGTAWFMASMQGHKEVMELFIEKGVVIDIFNSDQYRNVLWILSGMPLEILEQCKYEAEIRMRHYKAKDQRREIIVYHDTNLGRFTCDPDMKQKEFMEFLIKNGNAVNIENEHDYLVLKSVLDKMKIEIRPFLTSQRMKDANKEHPFYNNSILKEGE